MTFLMMVVVAVVVVMMVMMMIMLVIISHGYNNKPTKRANALTMNMLHTYRVSSLPSP